MGVRGQGLELLDLFKGERYHYRFPKPSDPANQRPDCGARSSENDRAVPAKPANSGTSESRPRPTELDREPGELIGWSHE